MRGNPWGLARCRCPVSSAVVRSWRPWPYESGVVADLRRDHGFGGIRARQAASTGACHAGGGVGRRGRRFLWDHAEQADSHRRRRRPTSRPSQSSSLEFDGRHRGLMRRRCARVDARAQAGRAPASALICSLVRARPAKTPSTTPKGGCSHQSSTRPSTRNSAKPDAAATPSGEVCLRS